MYMLLVKKKMFMILLAQLKTLKNIDLGHVICGTTDLDEVPSNIYDPLR